MRLTIFILSLLFPLLPMAAQPKYEVRAAWLTALYGLDWPRTDRKSTRLNSSHRL